MKKPEFKLDKKGKKLVLSIGAGAAAAAILVGVVFGVRGRGEPVGVYPFVMVGMTEFWGDNQESYGPVTTDKIQTVFLSDTQTVTEVKVKQGDQVKKGDVLLTYDTTLSELELERKRLDVEKAKLQVKEAEEELARINQMEPMGDVNITLPEVDYGDELSAPYKIQTLDAKFDGSSPEKAVLCWLKDSTPVNNALLRQLYYQAMMNQIENEKQAPSSGSAMPSEEKEETGDITPPENPGSNPPENPEANPENTEGQDPENTTDPSQDEIPDPDPEPEPDPEPDAFTLFAERAPESLRIWADVSEGGTVQVYQGDAVTLTFTNSVTDWEHSNFVTWSLEPGSGPLRGYPNGKGYTVSGIASDIGQTRYTVKAVYQVDGVPTLTATRSFTLDVIPKPTVDAAAVNSFYTVLKVTQENKEQAPVTVWQGLKVTVSAGGGFGFSFCDAPSPDTFLPESSEEDDSFPEIDFGSGMTAAEIAKLRKEQVKKVKDLAAAAKMTESEYNLMEREFNDGNIRATLDGEVVTLLTEEESKENHTPMMKVSGGGGFYVEGSVSELEKDTLKPGQEVTINDWNTGMTYTGEVQSIGDFPVTGNGWNGMGNPNASYYPFHVFIDGSADLQEGSYVSVTYSAAEAENGIYLENPFLRTDDGEPYVYVRGKNGRLEKRMVTTGKSLWGSYTQILSGLTEEDYIAFPYGKTVKPGAATEEAELSALYGY